MKEKILSILEDIDEEIVEYDGENLIEAGIIDSLIIMEILNDIEDILKVHIAPEDIIQKNFETKDAIVSLVEKYVI